MMSDTFCGFDGKRDEAIVAYLYGELGPAERTAFTRHLTRCLVCRREIDALGDLRAELAAWSPPEQQPGGAGAFAVSPALRSVPSGEPSGTLAGAPVPATSPAWRSLPAWAQFAAAVLFLGVSAGFANLQVTYDRDGLVVRTGWSDQPVVRSRPSPIASSMPPAAPSATAAPSGAAVSQADLAALVERLRGEWQASRPPAAPSPAAVSAADAVLVRRVRTLVRESEQRQQRELALRLAEAAQDAQAQRQADLVRIDRTLGALQSTTGTAVRRQEQLLNNLAVRVSQRQ